MKTKTTFGISFPNPELLEQAKARAMAMGLSFSAYINQLIQRDLGMTSAMSPLRKTPLYAIPEPNLEQDIAAEVDAPTQSQSQSQGQSLSPKENKK